VIFVCDLSFFEFCCWSRVVMSFIGPSGSKQTRPATPQLPPALNWYATSTGFVVFPYLNVLRLHFLLSDALSAWLLKTRHTAAATSTKLLSCTRLQSDRTAQGILFSLCIFAAVHAGEFYVTLACHLVNCTVSL
jgi:hypothetical protein